MPPSSTILASLALLTAAAAAAQSAPPRLETHGQATELMVDSQPFLILGGELHNSSSSSPAYMDPVWPRLASMHLNTVVLPVAWETIEPSEGQFDFATVDALLEGARRNHLKLVFLWFGAWKNTYSTYVPAWVKIHSDRFPRVQTADGRSTERLSPFSPAVRDADAHAFSALMHHLKLADSANHTVLLVQVENEPGVIPESRDHSRVANDAFAAPVPPSLTAYLREHRTELNPELRSAWESAGARTSGTWQQVFGATPLTDDLFMAWHYATFIDTVARAGKAEYPLPMYSNAALIRPNYQPGQYNSGGPLPHSLDLWRAAAPNLDFFSPDIYFNEFALWASSYTRPGNPLFIPEAQGGAAGAANALYAFGRLHALGFSPFGIDDEGNTPLDLVGITRAGERPGNQAIADTYALLAQLSPTILEAQRSGIITAALLESEAQRSARQSLGDYTATITRTGSATERIGVLFLQTAPGEFLITGAGESQITFSSDKPGPPNTGILSIDEQFFRGGKSTMGRRLNGDESGQGSVVKILAGDLHEGKVYRVRLYRYR